MDVTAAIKKRRSIRAYSAKEVDKNVLTEILELAARSPSWANSQPWDVFVATGKTMDRIKAAYAENYAAAVKTSTDLPRPAEWPQAAKDRQKGIRPDMLRDCGDAADQFGELNRKIFNAPALIVICLDKLYAHWGLYDLGAYSQSIMLLAAERGLATIPAITSVSYPDVIRRELKIPDNLNIAIGIAIGYEDPDNRINNFCSARSPLSETVSFSD